MKRIDSKHLHGDTRFSYPSLKVATYKVGKGLWVSFVLGDVSKQGKHSPVAWNLTLKSQRIYHFRFDSLIRTYFQPPFVTARDWVPGFAKWVVYKKPMVFVSLLFMEEILHQLGCIKPCKQENKLSINWCRISSINSMNTLSLQYSSDLFVVFATWNRWNFLVLVQSRIQWQVKGGLSTFIPFFLMNWVPSQPCWPGRLIKVLETIQTLKNIDQFYIGSNYEIQKNTQKLTRIAYH